MLPNGAPLPWWSPSDTTSGILRHLQARERNYHMKKLSVFALVAALTGSACGGGTFGPVTEIDQTKT